MIARMRHRPARVVRKLQERHRRMRTSQGLRSRARARSPATCRSRSATPAGRPPAAAPDSYVQGVATDVGEFRNVLLPDGSVVGLNTNSVVEIVYSAAERRIRLTRGEAFFTVAKNPNRPFWVEADGVSVRAVGTAFDVRDRPDAIEVLVREGKVQVHRAGSAQPAALLVAGEKAVVSRAATSAAARVSVAAMKLVAGEPVRRFLAATDRPSAGNMVARDDGGRERKP